MAFVLLFRVPFYVFYIDMFKEEWAEISNFGTWPSIKLYFSYIHRQTHSVSSSVASFSPLSTLFGLEKQSVLIFFCSTVIARQQAKENNQNIRNQNFYTFRMFWTHILVYTTGLCLFTSTFPYETEQKFLSAVAKQSISNRRALFCSILHIYLFWFTYSY